LLYWLWISWFWCYCVAVRTTGTDCHSGIITGSSSLFQFASTSVFYGEDGKLYVDGSVATNYGITIAIGDVVGIAVDMDAAKIYFYKNGTLINTGGTSFTTTGNDWFFKVGTYFSSSVNTVNFGQRAFAYPVSGFKALCTQNLPAPLVTKSNTVMDVALWTGTGVGGRAVTGLNFNPDLVWLKRRSSGGANSHQLHDVVRGAATGALYSDLTNAEDSNYPITSFDTAGFTLGSSASLASQSYASQNETSQTYVGWAWDAGTSTVSNTQGSITSSVRANATAGFSVVTYTGTGSSATVGHGLGVAPSLIIVKARDNSSYGGEGWNTYHSSLAAGYAVQLNSTQAQFTGMFTSTLPTSTVFTLSTNSGVNQSPVRYVAYCFAPVVGYTSMGSYTGDGSTSGFGPFIYCGFRPKFVLIKSSSVSYSWLMFDSVRNPYNLTTQVLYADSSAAEMTNNGTGSGGYESIDILSNGFQIKSNSARYNQSGATYIYFAVAESPFNYSRAR